MSSLSFVLSSKGLSSGSDRQVNKEPITVPDRSSQLESNKSSPSNRKSVGNKDNSEGLFADERSERAEENWSLRRGYEWVDFHVHPYFSQYQWSTSLWYFLSKAYLFYANLNEDIIAFRICPPIDNVCHDRENSVEDFFYFYSCLNTYMHI